MADLREVIERELEEKKAEKSAQGYPNAEKVGVESYFNNFHFNLPDSRYDHGGRYRDLSVDVGKMDTPRTDNAGDQYEGWRNSELYLNQTPREFFATVDTVLAELEIPLDRINQLQEPAETELDARVELFELVMPVYVKLMEMGYSRRDLTT